MNLNAESTIASIVEGMLPRCSDHELGLLISVSLSMSDYGYGSDGNTYERDVAQQHRFVHFLFVRPSNYTQVFAWIPEDDSVGLDLWPQYRNEIIWDLLCDHDSCWRSSVSDFLNKVESDMVKHFEGRKISGRVFNPYQDTSRFYILDKEPKYVSLTLDRVHPREDRFSTEGRLHKIKFGVIDFDHITMLNTPDSKQMGKSGLLLVDSKDHKRYLDTAWNLMLRIKNKES